MIINLCFHGIGTCATERETGESRYWVSTPTFLNILDAVTDEPAIRLSFDDGNASDVDVAMPALRDRGLTATFFPLAGRLKDPASLSANDLRELRSAGMRIGSHGWDHVPWRGLAVSEAKRELDDARVALSEASGGAINEAALPLGRYDKTLLRRLKAAGYDTVYTSDRFPARPTSWLQARYSATSSDTETSIRRLLRVRVGRREARNVIASFVKRAR